MARVNYSFRKQQKELKRQKKREEKRQHKLDKKTSSPQRAKRKFLMQKEGQVPIDSLAPLELTPAYGGTGKPHWN